jgi:hypothetical protein
MLAPHAVRYDVRRAAVPVGPPVGTPAPEVAGFFGRLRGPLERYAGGRRAAGAPLGRVLAEVQALARTAAAAEGWWDLTDLLVPLATRWTLKVYAAEDSVPEATAAGQAAPAAAHRA